MKRIIILTVIIMTGCTSERANWDSGAAAQNSYQQERQEEQVESTRNQFPSTKPATDNSQPF